MTLINAQGRHLRKAREGGVGSFHPQVIEYFKMYIDITDRSLKNSNCSKAKIMSDLINPEKVPEVDMSRNGVFY